LINLCKNHLFKSFSDLISPLIRFYNYIRSFALHAIITLLLINFLAAINNLNAQNSTIRVIAITQDEGTPVIAANVLLTIPGADTLYARSTDAYGFVEFNNIPARDYEIQISYIGYQTYREIITLEPGATLIFRPELVTDTAVLGELVVSVRRGTTRRDAGMQTITPEDLSRMPTPAPGGDLTMYLQSLPSVVTTGDRGGELHIRGGTPSQNLILVENMPIVKPFHISNLFSALPQDVLSSVDVYAGGFGSQYSGATSAVLDINLRQGNMRRFQSKAALSPYIVSLQAEGPVVVDNHSFLLMGRYSVIEDTGPRLTGEEVPLRFYDLVGRYSINWDGAICNFTGLRTNDEGRINPLRGVQLSWSNTAIGVRCLGFAEELNHAVDITIGYTGYESSETGIDNIGRESNLKMGYMRMDNRAQFIGSPANYGFKLEFIKYDAILDDPFAQQQGRAVRFTGVDAQLDELATNLSSYVTLNLEPFRNLRFRPGLVSQINIRDLQPTLEPRARLSWNPAGNEDLEFSLAAGRYVQMHEAINDERDAGTVFYVYKPIHERDPYPVSLHSILGYRQQFTQAFGLSVEAYAKQHKDIPVARWTREPANTLETGLVESFTYGGDIQAELNIRNFYLSLSYGISEVTYKAPSSELVAWIDRPVFSYNPAHDRRHQINLISSMQFGNYTASISYQFGSGGPFTRLFAFDLALLDLPRQNPLQDQGRAMTLFSEPFDGKLPNFQRLDASVSRSFRFTPSFGIDAEIGAVNTFNITNVFYYDVNTLQQVNQLPLVPYISLTTILR
jgi:hypothetical protein